MGIFSRLRDTFSAYPSDKVRPEATERPETFSDYLRRVIFPKEGYELRRVSFSEENQDQVGPPLFTFRCQATGQEFLVDASFREAVFYEDKVEWCKPGRLRRYQEVSRHDKPVFLTLGLGRQEQQPEAVYIIPVSQTTYSGLSHGSLRAYAFPTDQPVAANNLWRLW
jgi:hypothetical protein